MVVRKLETMVVSKGVGRNYGRYKRGVVVTKYYSEKGRKYLILAVFTEILWFKGRFLEFSPPPADQGRSFPRGWSLEMGGR